MKKILFIFVTLFYVGFLGLSGCGNSSTNNNDTTTWQIKAVVDLGGKFDVTGTAKITVTGDKFSATITTDKIGGQTEIHEIALSGTVKDNKYTIKDSKFELTSSDPKSPKENIVVTGELTVDGDKMTGSGTMTVGTEGSKNTMKGSFTITGNK